MMIAARRSSSSRLRRAEIEAVKRERAEYHNNIYTEG